MSPEVGKMGGVMPRNVFPSHRNGASCKRLVCAVSGDGAPGQSAAARRVDDRPLPGNGRF